MLKFITYNDTYLQYMLYLYRIIMAAHMKEIEPPTAKRLILSLLAAPSLSQVEIGRLVSWGALFDIDSATMRVTASRLLRQGLLDSPARGVYRIGPRGKLLSNTARAWLTAEQRGA